MKKLLKENLDIDIILELGKKILTLLDSKQLLDMLCLTIIGRLMTDYILVYLSNPEKGENSFYLAVSKGINQKFFKKNISIDNKTIKKINVNKILEFKNNNTVFKHLHDIVVFDKKKIKFELYLPVIFDDDIIGFLLLGPRFFDEKYNIKNINFLDILRSFLSISIKNSLLYNQVIIDNLTKFYSRQYFHLRLNEEISRFRRYKKHFSLLMYDIDDFKHINDTYGHIVGDQVLKYLSDIIKGNIRTIDIPCRVGGEEFMIILPNTNLKNSIILAERLIKKLNNNKFDNKFKVTVSIGLAEYKDKYTADQFINLVDYLMYKSKENGKNQYSYNTS